ncbi:MAG: SAM-dependent methyltransferase [Chitinivorax sp.]|jgi:predicted nicotinamide N-methyase
MPGYQVKFEDVAIRGGADLHIRSLLDCQQFSDPEGLAEAAGISSAAWPLFGMIWPSARVLAGVMQSHEVAGKRILEIGCGLALASIVAHRRLADITASDCHPLTGNFLQHNLKLNALPPLKYQTGNWSRANPQLGKFDLIIGSDVLYERGQAELLSAFIETHAAADVEVIIIDPNRGYCGGLNRNMDQRGFQLQETRMDYIQADGANYRGRMLNYQRN